MTDRAQAVIFDCDGTLVDSETPGLDVLHALVGELGIAMSREDAHTAFRGKRMALCVEEIGQQLDPLPPDFHATFLAHVRAAMADRFRAGLTPMPGALELVSRLRVPYCIATNGPREKAELTLGVSGLLPWFQDRLFCAYEVGIFKPDPGLFLHAAHALGVAPQHCVVVEDSAPGVEAGLAAGMRVYAVCPPEHLPAHLASRVRFLRSLAELDPAAP